MLTAEEKRTGVQRLGPWFHQIDLGDGVLTKSRPAGTEPLDHPRSTWELVGRCLPADLEGRSVLDVGCNAGFYAIQARRRNAGRVLGIDARRQHVRQARFAARALGLQIEYERMSVYDLSPQVTGMFDVTLALGLLYHCRHPLLAIEKLFGVTRDLLVVESEVLFPSPSFPPTEQAANLGRPLHPLAYVENHTALNEPAYNWFVPGVDSLMAMLRDAGFVEVKLAYEPAARALIVCRRPLLQADSLSMPHMLAAQLSMVEGPAACRPDESLAFRVAVKNTGLSLWLDRGPGAVRLGVRLLDEAGEELVPDYGGVAVGHQVGPGGEVLLNLSVTAPSRPGIYRLEFDMVSEQVTWFEEAGATMALVHRVRVS